jgi:hypothetical protein
MYIAYFVVTGKDTYYVSIRTRGILCVCKIMYFCVLCMCFGIYVLCLCERECVRTHEEVVQIPDGLSNAKSNAKEDALY